MNFNPIEKQRIINAIPPTAVLTSTGAYISLKNVNKAYGVVYVNNSSACTMVATPYQATAVAGTGAKVFANPMNIWVSSSQDGVLTKSSVATTYTFSATTGAVGHTKMCIFEIDPGLMDQANNFDCLSIQITSSSSVGLQYAAFYVTDMRYGEAVIPTLTSD